MRACVPRHRSCPESSLFCYVCGWVLALCLEGGVSAWECGDWEGMGGALRVGLCEVRLESVWMLRWEGEGTGGEYKRWEDARWIGLSIALIHTIIGASQLLTYLSVKMKFGFNIAALGLALLSAVRGDCTSECSSIDCFS